MTKAILLQMVVLSASIVGETPSVSPAFVAAGGGFHGAWHLSCFD
jgi:hypothetical protein